MRVSKSNLKQFVRDSPKCWRLIMGLLLPLLPIIFASMAVWEHRHEIKEGLQYGWAFVFKRWED